MMAEKQEPKPAEPESCMPVSSQGKMRSVSEDDYRLLTAWRDSLRDFMTASKGILKQARVTPAEYQALLSIRLHTRQEPMTMGALALHLHIRHNSAVTLVNRMTLHALVRRVPSNKDSRMVHLRLTAKGETVLRKLVSAHRRELDGIAPALRKILAQREQ
jgi:DNA-binding MarR family transcriptional regulator